jgi:polyketide synthase 12/myxalamid-type polyketide synthase MxaB
MDWVARLEPLSTAKRANLLVAFVHGQAVKVLGLDASRTIDPRRPLNELGLDSLMAVELRNALGMALKRSLPATLLFDYPTLQALSGYLLHLLFPEVGAAPVKESAERTQAALELQGISDEQAEALLLDELAAGRNEGWK